MREAHTRHSVPATRQQLPVYQQRRAGGAAPQQDQAAGDEQAGGVRAPRRSTRPAALTVPSTGVHPVTQVAQAAKSNLSQVRQYGASAKMGDLHALMVFRQ